MVADPTRQWRHATVQRIKTLEDKVTLLEAKLRQLEAELRIRENYEQEQRERM